jgi:hypothetical protein
VRVPGIGSRYRNGSGYVLVKMGRLVVVGTVTAGSERSEWRRTQLHPDGGAWGVDHWHVPGWFRHYLDGGARRLQGLVEGLSQRQKQRTHEKKSELIAKDAGAMGSSGAFRAFEADLELFGDIVFRSVDDDGGPETT